MVRIYQSPPLAEQTLIQLDDNAFAHVVKSLRMKINEQITLFDGSNRELTAFIEKIDKKNIWVKTEQFKQVNRESHLKITLGQVISRGEKMEFTIQKSVELGVNCIVPLISERCGVKLDNERYAKKIIQWQKIAIAACEQSGRNTIPTIEPVQQLNQWCADIKTQDKILLEPTANINLNEFKLKQSDIVLLIGPEGGFSSSELEFAKLHEFNAIRLGPRVLRTETASLVALSALQFAFGDLS